MIVSVNIMLTVLNSLLPVFLLILLGLLLRKYAFLKEEVFSGMSRLVYWVTFPSLLFFKISTASFDVSSLFNQLSFVMLVHFLALGIVYLIVLAVGIRGSRLAVIVQGAFRGNLAFIGLPVITYALASAPGPFSIQEADIYLVLSAMILFFNIAAVVLFIVHGDRKGRGMVSSLFLGMIKNPLIIACLAGLAFSLTGLKLPPVFNNSLSLLGKVSLPMALLTIGASLQAREVRQTLLTASLTGIFKTVTVPLIGLAVLYLLGRSWTEYRILFVFFACPTAVSSFVLTEQMGGDHRLSGNIIVVGTMISFFSLSTVLFLL